LAVALLFLALLTPPLAADWQTAGRARMALLETSAPDSAWVAWWAAFRQRMRELTWVKGQNVETPEDRARRAVA
jgi:hypothetical protein